MRIRRQGGRGGEGGGRGGEGGGRERVEERVGGGVRGL